MKTTEWCRNYNEKRRVKREQLANLGGLGARKIIASLRGCTFSIGANKRILFVPDVKSITKLNNIYVQLQSFVTNDVYTKYRGVGNYSTIDYIFSKLSSDNSLVTSNTNDRKFGSVKKMCNGDIISLYDENEDNFLNKLIAQLSTRDHNYNYNHNESNISDGDIAKMVAQNRNPLIELQSEIDYAVSQSYSNSNSQKERLPRDIAVKYKTAVKNIDFSKHNLTQDDVKIDYNTWRLKIARNARPEYYESSPLRNMYCNHYYYHTLQCKHLQHSTTMRTPNRLDYNIEQDRKLFEYPKLYNIDYDCVEKAYKWHVTDYVKSLKSLEEMHPVPGPRHWRRMRLRRLHGIDKYDPHKDIYYSLHEFYHDCGYDDDHDELVSLVYGNIWTTHDNKYGICRSVDNMEDYDLYRGVEKDVGDLPVLLIGNTDRMYNVKLNTMIKKWYKNGKYLLYAILPQEKFDHEESSLSIDFCHFEIYHNRLKLLQSVVGGEDGCSNYNYDHDILSKYVWIALNDCSRYCKDELYRQQKLCADKIITYYHDQELIKIMFRNDNKATWDRRNKNKYKSPKMNQV